MGPAANGTTRDYTREDVDALRGGLSNATDGKSVVPVRKLECASCDRYAARVKKLEAERDALREILR